MNPEEIDPNQLYQIILESPITEINRICSSLTQSRFQRICRDENLWKQLLYRDYGSLYGNIISSVVRENAMSYYDLYKEFYTSPFFNSPDFQIIYSIFSKYLPIVYFKTEEGVSIITSLRDDLLWIPPKEMLSIQIPIIFEDIIWNELDSLINRNYKVNSQYNMPTTINFPARIVNSKLIFERP